jgi:hypothetical protein
VNSFDAEGLLGTGIDDVGYLPLLRALECADVCHDRPPILGGKLVGVGQHVFVRGTNRDGVEKFAFGAVAQAVFRDKWESHHPVLLGAIGLIFNSNSEPELKLQF